MATPENGVEHLLEYWPIIVGIVGTAVGWGYLKTKVAQNTEHIHEIAVIVKELANRKLVSVEDCFRNQNHCAASVCTKIDDLKSVMEKSIAIRVELSAEIQRISNYIEFSVDPGGHYKPVGRSGEKRP